MCWDDPFPFLLRALPKFWEHSRLIWFRSTHPPKFKGLSSLFSTDNLFRATTIKILFQRIFHREQGLGMKWKHTLHFLSASSNEVACFTFCSIFLERNLILSFLLTCMSTNSIFIFFQLIFTWKYVVNSYVYLLFWGLRLLRTSTWSRKNSNKCLPQNDSFTFASSMMDW